MSYPKHGQFIDAAGQVKCLKCKWILSKCKCGEPMSFMTKTDTDLAKVYYDKWLDASTNGNVMYAAEYDPASAETRFRFSCTCGSVLAVKNLVDAGVVVPYEVQEFIKLHKHPKENTLACPKCWKGMAYIGNVGTEKVYRCGNECPSPNGATFWTAGDITAFELSKANPVPASVGYTFTYTTKPITPFQLPKLETPRDAVRAALKLHREGRRFR